MIIALMGYMGSGKSTIGKDLAKILNFEFIDLDHYIVEHEAKSITDIFKHKGELYFRKKENQYLTEILSTKKQIVLALGGGTPCYSNNINLLKTTENLQTVYIKYSINVLTERLFIERHNRPLIAHIDDKNTLKEFIGKHLFERTQFYNQAFITINGDGKTKQEVVENLITFLF